MNLVEQATKEIDEFISYYGEKKAQLEKRRALFLETAQRLEALVKDHKVTFWSDKVEITTDSVEKSRKLMTSLLEGPVTLFEKESSSSSSGMVWKARGKIEDISILIAPVEPSPDCEVVEHLATYRSYSCKPKA